MTRGLPGPIQSGQSHSPCAIPSDEFALVRTRHNSATANDGEGSLRSLISWGLSNEVSDPVERLLSRVEEVLLDRGLIEVPENAAEISRLIGPDLGSLCDRGLVDRSALRRLEELIETAPLQMFERLMFLAGTSWHYAEARYPDDADRVIREATPSLALLDDPDELDQILNLFAFALDNLNQTERANELRSRVVRLHEDGPLEEFWRATMPEFDEVPVALQRRRDDELIEMLDQCDDPNDATAIDTLHGALQSGEGFSPFHRARGWRRLAVLWSYTDRGRMWSALFNAWDALAPLLTGYPDVAGQIALRLSEEYLADGDQAHASKWLRRASDLYFEIRDSAADPTIRSTISDDVGWIDDLIFQAFSVEGEGTALFRCLARSAAHGLEGVLDPAEPVATSRDRTIVERFASVWAPADPDPWHIAAALPPHCGALHARMIEHDDATYVVTQLVIGDNMYSTRSHVDPILLKRTFPVTASRILRLRDDDWAAWSRHLLPDELLDHEQGVGQVVAALGGGLESIPLAHLPAAGARLLDRYTVHTMPLLPLWERLPDTRVRVGSVVYLGVDSRENSTTGLPGVDDEVGLLRSLGADVAQVRSLEELKRTPRGDLWVFGIHGRIDRGRNVFLFPDESQVPSDTLADLDMAPILIGATCWSGSLRSHPSPFSLVPAAFLGGARALVLTLWDAETHRVHDVLQRLYPRLIAGENVASALAEAQRGVGGGAATPPAMAALAR